MRTSPHARCFCLHPGPHQGPGKFSTHTSSGSSRQRGSLPGPSAQRSLSQQAFLEVLFIFSVSTSSPPCHCFSPCGLAPRRPRPGLHSTAGPFAAKASHWQQSKKTSLSRKNSSVCLLALSVKLINPRSAYVTINCTSQSCIFKQGTAYNSHLQLYAV